MPYKINQEGSLEADERERNERLAVRSNDVKEILSYRPDFLVRYGNMIFLLVLLMIATACWLIRYPDMVSGKAILVSVNAPKPVIARAEGKLIMLNMREDQRVREGDVIGFIQSTAKHEQVLALSFYLDTLSVLLAGNNDKALLHHKETDFSELGELQESFQIFTQSLSVYGSYMENGFFVKKERMLEADKIYLIAQNKILSEQKKLQEQDAALAQKTFAMNDTLMKQKVISALEYRNEQSKYLSKQQALPQISSVIITNENQQNDKDKEISELKATAMQQKAIFIQALQTLRSHVEEWKRKYLLTATAEGNISLSGFWEVNQTVKNGDVICYISSNSSCYAQMLIPQANFGKVRQGEDVVLKFQAFPTAEWGNVRGKVDFISRIPTDSGYLAKIILPKGLTTDYDKVIQYHNGLVATGYIITADRRLLQQLYYDLYGHITR